MTDCPGQLTLFDSDALHQPCWVLLKDWCASRANGRTRCRPGRCYLLADTVDTRPL